MARPLVQLFLLFSCLLVCLAYLVINTNKEDSSTHQTVEWIETLIQFQSSRYSQSGEDGIIYTIFQHVGTTDKVYVEFGAEDCWECNTRYLRETGWDVNNSLLMDGMHSNPKINLKKVIFWPSNIIQLFEKFGVKKEFDFLSVDTDNYDWFMLEAILLGGYRPRVICVEVNSRFEMEDAKSIPPPSDGVSWEQWDGTAYHGASDLAMYYLFNRFGYSMVFCNYSNCFGVRDDVLGVYVRRPISSLFVQNDGVAAGFNHPCDLKNRSLAVIDPSGRWLGELDGGKGSPTIRYKGCGRRDNT